MKNIGYQQDALPVLFVWADIQERRPEFKGFVLVGFEQTKTIWKAYFQNDEMRVGLQGSVQKMRDRLGLKVVS